MATRLIDLVFRNKLLLLLPVILGLIGGVFLTAQADSGKFRSAATVWVERPSEITGAAFTDLDPFAAPASNQVASMNQLLNTKSFVTGVLESLHGPAPEGGFPGFMYDELREGTSLTTGGNNVLFVAHSARTAEEAQGTVNAIIDEYANLYGSQIRERAERAIVFYEDQLDQARDVFSTASAELRAYVSTHGELQGLNTNSLPPDFVVDPELAALIANEQTAKANYDDILASFAASEVAAQAASGTSTNFVVIDDPELPTDSVVRSKRDILMPPLLGVVAGTFLSAFGLVLLWRLDRIVRLPSDLAYLGADVPVVSLPSLKTKRKAWPVSFVRLAAAVQAGIWPRQLPAPSPGPDVTASPVVR